MNILHEFIVWANNNLHINDIIFISDKLRSGSGVLVAVSSVLIIYVLLLICLVDCVTYSYIGLGLAGAEFFSLWWTSNIICSLVRLLPLFFSQFYCAKIVYFKVIYTHIHVK